jgi:hypothetical protein
MYCVRKPKKKRDNTVRASEPSPRKKSAQTRHGPEPERLKIEGDWVEAVDKALAAKRPPQGWPKP